MPNISLTKPAETDIYDIAVFNENATTIEEFINGPGLTKLIKAVVDTALSGQLDYLPFFNKIDSSFDIGDSTLNTGLYLFDSTTSSGSLPGILGGLHLLYVTNSNNIISQKIISLSNQPSYTRTYNSSTSSWSGWRLCPYLLNNWLDINIDGDKALSAQLGMYLYENKLEVYVPESEINIDTSYFGIYVCDNLSTLLGTFPSPSQITSRDNFILLALGKNNENSTVQIYISIVDNNSTYIRSKTGSLSWSAWTSLSSESSGGGDTTIKINPVNL